MNTTDYLGHDAPPSDWIEPQVRRELVVVETASAALVDCAAVEGYRVGRRVGRRAGLAEGFMAASFVALLLNLAVALLGGWG